MTQRLATALDAVGWTLVHFLWQGALVGAVAALMLALLRGAHPRLRYLAACAGLAACVAWPAASLLLRLRGTDASDAAAGAAQAAMAIGTGALQPWMPWLVTGWALASAALLARTACGVAWIVRASGTARTDPRWQARLDTLAHAMGVARRVRLCIVDGIASPVTALWWQPVVLVPASLLSGMPPDLLHALLAHEMAHVRRHDYLVNLLQNLAESLLFYHPAVWWLSRRIRIERELIADDLAAGHAGGPRRLAHALSELEKRQFAHHEPALAADGGDLMNRITRLLRPAARRNPSAISAVLAAALPALALACACAAGLAHANAAAEKADQVDKEAFIDLRSCAKPAWPQASLAAKETGTVTLKFLVEADGKVADSRIVKSSGHPALDEASREGIGKCQFVPARAKGKPVKSWVALQYVWTLE
jgi:D-alanyl-D-alanine endopeptidase (penicillin-binding protein 7)